MFVISALVKFPRCFNNVSNKICDDHATLKECFLFFYFIFPHLITIPCFVWMIFLSPILRHRTFIALCIITHNNQLLELFLTYNFGSPCFVEWHFMQDLHLLFFASKVIMAITSALPMVFENPFNLIGESKKYNVLLSFKFSTHAFPPL